MFVLTLGCSRKAVRLLSFRSSSRIWAELHEKAFRRLGGSTRIVVLDNLKEGVLVPTSTIPLLKSLYRERADSLWLCRLYRAGSKIQIEKEKLSAASDTPRTHPQGKTLREPGRSGKPIWIVGNQLRRYPHPRHHQTASRRHVCRRKTVLCSAALEPFRY